MGAYGMDAAVSTLVPPTDGFERTFQSGAHTTDTVSTLVSIKENINNGQQINADHDEIHWVNGQRPSHDPWPAIGASSRTRHEHLRSAFPDLHWRSLTLYTPVPTSHMHHDTHQSSCATAYIAIITGDGEQMQLMHQVHAPSHNLHHHSEYSSITTPSSCGTHWQHLFIHLHIAVYLIVCVGTILVCCDSPYIDLSNIVIQVMQEYLLGWALARMRIRISRIAFHLLISQHTSTSLFVLSQYSREIILLIIASCVHCAHAMDETSPEYTKLLNVEIWDSIPSPYFRLSSGWFSSLRIALANVFQDHDSLLRCARRQDIGRDAVGAIRAFVAAVPAQIAADGAIINAGAAAVMAQPSQQEVDGHANRKRRLYAAILQKISRGSSLYHLFTTDANFMAEGIAVYEYIFEVGHVAFSEDQTKALIDIWNNMTLMNMKVPIEANSLYFWRQVISKAGEPLNKGPRQARRKFYVGLPESFDAVVSNERRIEGDGTYVFPAHYPPHHPRAGDVHIQANSPDLDLIARAFSLEWGLYFKRGQVKPVPRGSVYSVTTARTEFAMLISAHQDEFMETATRFISGCDSSSSASPASTSGVSSGDTSGDQAAFQQHTPHATALAIQRSQINSSTRCHTCGGLGHVSSIDGKSCLTRELGISIPKPTLLQIKYPTGEPMSRQLKEALIAELPEDTWRDALAYMSESGPASSYDIAKCALEAAAEQYEAAQAVGYQAAQAVGYRSDGGRGGRGKGKQPFVRRRFPGKGKGKPAPINQQADLAQDCDYDEPEQDGEVFSIEYDSIVVSNNAPTAEGTAFPDSD